MSSQSPTDDEILAAVRILWTVSNPPGVKRLVASLKAEHPEWEPYINSGKVRVAVRQCETETGVSNKSAEEDKKSQKSTSANGGGADKGSQEDGLAPLVAHAESLRTRIATHPWPRKGTIYSPRLIHPDNVGLVMLPADAANPSPDSDEPIRKLYLAFHLFYLEWDCFIGPNPDEALPPATPIYPNYEAMAFVTLFPYGVGHYLGPEQQNGLTFEEYALNRLKLADERFRGDAQWLTWALTRTADPALAKAINCVLVLLHKQKARHLGKGQVQVLSLNETFESRAQADSKKQSKKQ